MAEWISVGIAAFGLVGAVVAALIRVSNAVAGNTAATAALSDWLDKQDSRLTEHGKQLDDHESRIVSIETVHRVRGCDEAGS